MYNQREQAIIGPDVWECKTGPFFPAHDFSNGPGRAAPLHSYSLTRRLPVQFPGSTLLLFNYFTGFFTCIFIPSLDLLY